MQTQLVLTQASRSCCNFHQECICSGRVFRAEHPTLSLPHTTQPTLTSPHPPPPHPTPPSYHPSLPTLAPTLPLRYACTSCVDCVLAGIFLISQTIIPGPKQRRLTSRFGLSQGLEQESRQVMQQPLPDCRQRQMALWWHKQSVYTSIKSAEGLFTRQSLISQQVRSAGARFLPASCPAHILSIVSSIALLPLLQIYCQASLPSQHKLLTPPTLTPPPPSPAMSPQSLPLTPLNSPTVNSFLTFSISTPYCAAYLQDTGTQQPFRCVRNGYGAASTME